MKLRELEAGQQFILVPSDPDTKLMFAPKVWLLVKHSCGMYGLCETDQGRRIELRSDSNVRIITDEES